MGTGHSVDEPGVCAWGVVAASVAGLGPRDVVSPFNRVTVGLLDPLWHSFALGLTSGVGERAPFAWGAVSSVIEAAPGLGRV
jgi:hypothetical protein